MPLSSVTVIEAGRAIELGWDDGRNARFHAIWLRDNVQDASTRDGRSGQRLITLAEIPTALTVEWAEIAAGGTLKLAFAPEGLSATFAPDWLAAHVYDRVRSEGEGWTDPRIATWDAASPPPLAGVGFEELVASEDARLDWLAGVRRHGFGLLTGLPVEPGALTRVVDTFGYVRETNYGRVFEVRAEVSPGNLAYTNLGLQVHTDNPYRDPVPTLQLLACLENTVEGGESVVVDGFRAALRLKETDQHAFERLARYSARFEYAGMKGVRLVARRPMIELQPDGELIAIRFNNRSAAPLADIPFEAMEAYYDAYRRFSTLLDDPAMQVRFKLAPGELFIVDNTRVLHGRTAFSSSGTRWLQGCYADKDGLLSTLAALEAQRR